VDTTEDKKKRRKCHCSKKNGQKIGHIYNGVPKKGDHFRRGGKGFKKRPGIVNSEPPGAVGHAKNRQKKKKRSEKKKNKRGETSGVNTGPARAEQRAQATTGGKTQKKKKNPSLRCVLRKRSDWASKGCERQKSTLGSFLGG